MGASEDCVLSIPANQGGTKRTDDRTKGTDMHRCAPGGGAAVLLTVHMPYRGPRPCTCDGGRRGFQEVLRVVGVGRLVLARLVQVAVTFSRIVRVPRTYKVVVCGTLVAARVECARRSLAGSAGFHVLVVGLGAPAFFSSGARQNRSRDGGRIGCTFGSGNRRCFGPCRSLRHRSTSNEPRPCGMNASGSRSLMRTQQVQNRRSPQGVRRSEKDARRGVTSKQTSERAITRDGRLEKRRQKQPPVAACSSSRCSRARPNGRPAEHSSSAQP